MEIEILAFGITKDIIGNKSLKLKVETPCRVRDLKILLKKDYPKLELLTSLMIAVNENYGDLDLLLQEGDEIALIPPVAGG